MATNNQKIINWKLVGKEDKKAFKSWLKSDQKDWYKNNFWRHFFNINKFPTLRKQEFEFLAYSNVVCDDRYKDVINHEVMVEVKAKDIRAFITKAIIETTEPKVQKTFENLVNWIFDIIDYKNINVKDFDKEYEMLKKYWVLIDELANSKIEEFNKWIIFINKHFYIKQQGFIKNKI